MTSPPHLLHVFATFTAGGPQVRTAGLIEVVGMVPRVLRTWRRLERVARDFRETGWS